MDVCEVGVWMCGCVECGCGCVDVCVGVWMCVDVCDVCSENVCGNGCDMDVSRKKGKVILKVVLT